MHCFLPRPLLLGGVQALEKGSLTLLTAGDRRVPPERNSREPRQAGRSYKTSLLMG